MQNPGNPDFRWIYDQLANPFTKAYFAFLQHALRPIVSLNKVFQTESVLISELHERIGNLFRTILAFYVNLEQVPNNEVTTTNYTNQNLHISLQKIDIGLAAKRIVYPIGANMDRFDELLEFFMNAKKFFVRATEMIQEKFDLNNEAFKMLQCLKPENALSRDFHENDDYGSDFQQILTAFPRALISQNQLANSHIKQQWNDVLQLANVEEFRLVSQDPVKFWLTVRNYRNDDNLQNYFGLGQFALNIMCIPHSNAECERIFSKLKLIKTSTRNRLNVKTIEVLLLACQYVADAGGAGQMQPSDELLEKMNSKMYTHRRKNMGLQIGQDVGDDLLLEEHENDENVPPED